MSDYLPYADFKWVNTMMTENQIKNISLHGRKGYFFDVTVEYPKDLHRKHNDLPFLPENMIPPGGNHSKLLTTFYTKKNYIVHHSALKQALEHGLKIVKVHRMLEFSQKPWLKQYIDANTRRRMEARNDFERDFFKLMNNAVSLKRI
jgi:DNA polymerase type B, organellar and viral